MTSETRAPRPITAREMLICSIPLATLYLLQGLIQKGLAFAGFISLALYLAYMLKVVPRIYKRPMSMIALLIIGGASALLVTMLANIAYLIFGPWSAGGHVLILGISGVDAPSLLIPLCILLYRIGHQALSWARHNRGRD